MQNWEYLVKDSLSEEGVVNTKAGWAKMEKYLDTLGENGWELVAVSPYRDSISGKQCQTLFLKRPKS
jgi:hypothetical protein